MDPKRFDELVVSLQQTSSRKHVLRLLGGGLVGGLLAAAGLRAAAARPAGDGTGDDTGGGDETGGGEPTAEELRPQQQFVRDCQAAGRTPSRVSTHVVRCCHKSGNDSICTTCDFNVSPPSCNDTITRDGGAGDMVDQPDGGPGRVNTP